MTTMPPLPTFLSGVTGYYTRVDDSSLLAIRPISYQSALLYFCDVNGNVLPFRLGQGLKIDGIPVGADHFPPDANGFVTLQMSTGYCMTWDINIITDIDYYLSDYFTLPLSQEERFKLYTVLVYGSANKDETTIRVGGPMERFCIGGSVNSDLLGVESTIVNVDYDENTITVDNPVLYSGSNVTLFI